MIGFLSKSEDPYFNLSAEEYLLKNMEEDVFMLWQSIPCVVVGKHQNALAEINYRYLKQNNILVARRLTGGGAVYHDSGNLNFTFITTGENGKLVDFERFIRPVILFLKTLGVSAEMGKKNEILVSGLKISGNAEHVFKNRVLHHGTLLYDTNMEMLHRAIQVIPGRYRDKAVISNRGHVVNLSECGLNTIPRDQFVSMLFDFIMQRNDGKPYSLNKMDMEAINTLSADKYGTRDWIFGWSPDYEFTNEFEMRGFRFFINLKTHRGIITETNININGFSEDMLLLFNKTLKGNPHSEECIQEAVIKCGLSSIFNREECRELVLEFF